mgnify:FL=1
MGKIAITLALESKITFRALSLSRIRLHDRWIRAFLPSGERWESPTPWVFGLFPWTVIKERTSLLHR